MSSLPNIEYAGDFCKNMSAADNKYASISFYKPREYFSLSENYTEFIKAVENSVRKSDDYKAYISYIKNVIGINFCQVSSDIIDTDATVEMHHGPLFTLWDYCSILLNKEIDDGKAITTFDISEKVIEEHFANRVQVVMLAVTNHEAVHNRDIFLNIRQGFGDIAGFIEIYQKYLTDNQKYRLARYISLCESTDSFDNNLFDVEKVKRCIPYDDI